MSNSISEAGKKETIFDQTTFFEKVNVKRVLICFHGFQTSTIHDLDVFKNYFLKVNKNLNYEVCLVDLYDFGQEDTYKAHLMMKRATEAVDSYLNKGYIVYLLAYSFSAGIAAKIAMEHPEITKIVLVSPTIYLIKTGLISGYFRLIGKHLRLKAMYRKKLEKMPGVKSGNKGFVRLALQIAKATSKYRPYLKGLKCKVLMLKGSKDELSIAPTFSYISKKSSSATTMSKIYPGKDHVMITTITDGKQAFDDILLFIFHMNSKETEDEKIF